MNDTHFDLLVLGSGVAGLSAAVRAAEVAGLTVGVVTKSAIEQTTTRWAQGGVAAALSGDVEEIDLHLADTLKAGVGLCDLEAVRVLVDEGPGRVHELIAMGAQFDRDAHGELELAREGGHSVARVVHAGGAATGAEIERALVEAVRSRAAQVFEQYFALDLLVASGRCVGVSVLDPHGSVHQLRADNTLLATGGAGQLFAVTTNPPEATGDGVAMALRAGVAVADLEFFQFHPTALAHVLMPRPLLSEALRGHGAMLRDSSGERFVDELLPRDVVSRAITAKMIEEGSRHVWLDATILHHFSLRFPTILADLEAAGLHPETDYLPVAPAAHHQCGGILTDLAGATSLPGLWAAGETSCSGVHGANRLASNSLLEGMVFGARVVEAIGAGATGPTHTGAMRSASLSATTDSVIGGSAVSVERPNFAGSDCPPEKIADLRSELQQSMTLHAGVLRSGASISAAHEVAVNVAAEVPRDVIRPDVCELRNLVEIASALLTAAASRTESRGSHSRTDFPAAQEIQRRRIVLNMAEASQ